MQKPGKKENFESSPTVVTSMSDSSELSEAVDILEPVEELSKLELEAVEAVLEAALLEEVGSESGGKSHMLCVSLCLLRSQFRRKTFLH